MADKTFHYQGADFKVGKGEPKFDGGAGHAVTEVDGCKAATISQKFTCRAGLLLKIPLGSTYRFGFVQVVRSLSRLGSYTDGAVQLTINDLPMFDSSMRADNVAFPFTKDTETVVVAGRAGRAEQFCYLRTNDRPRIGFPLQFPTEYVGKADEKRPQKLLAMADKISLTTWLAVRDESLTSDMKKILALGVALWEVDVEIFIDSKTGTIREAETTVDSVVGEWEFCKEDETVPTLAAEPAVWAQKQYWIPDHGAKARFHQQLLPGDFYRRI
jgi:hypothetical protein